MNQPQRLTKAIALLRPVLVSVQARRPNGFTPREADSLAGHLQIALDHLEAAAEVYSGELRPLARLAGDPS